MTILGNLYIRFSLFLGVGSEEVLELFSDGLFLVTHAGSRGFGGGAVKAVEDTLLALLGRVGALELAGVLDILLERLRLSDGHGNLAKASVELTDGELVVGVDSGHALLAGLDSLVASLSKRP